LQMAVRGRANPHVAISRRDRETIDSQDPLFVANRFSFRIEISKAVAIAFARVSRLIVADVAKAGLLRRFLRIGRDLEFGYLFFLFANALRFGGHVMQYASASCSGGL